MVTGQVVVEFLGVGEAVCLPSSEVLGSMCGFDSVLCSLVTGLRM